MKKAITHFIRRVREGHINHDVKRNFRVLLFASLLNLSFGVEKFFIVIGYPLPDIIWMCIYGTLALYVGWIAFYDLAKDMERIEEGHNQNIV